MSTVLSPPEARVVLHNISWSLYEQLLAAHEDKSSPRFVYDRGELEITVPSYEHEELNRLIDNCIAIIAMEWNIEYRDAGSTTFKRYVQLTECTDTSRLAPSNHRSPVSSPDRREKRWILDSS
jgi:Uma2 family endonuclease